MNAFWRSALCVSSLFATPAFCETQFSNYGNGEAVYQIVGCTETERECAISCADKLSYTSIYAPEACYDWFRKGLYICLCRIPSPD